MKMACLVLALLIVSVNGFLPQVSRAEQDGWKLISRNDRGSAYIDTASLSSPSKDIVRVKMKFEGKKGNSPMYFLDEVDCANNKIRRLEVSIHNPTCSGDGEPVYNMEFEGRWDALAEGLEQHLKNAVCK
jgi:hypothetical protein